MDMVYQKNAVDALLHISYQVEAHAALGKSVLEIVVPGIRSDPT